MSDSEEVTVGGLWSINHWDLNDGFEDRTINRPAKEGVFQEKRIWWALTTNDRESPRFIRSGQTWLCFQQLQRWSSVTWSPHDSSLVHQHPDHKPRKDRLCVSLSIRNGLTQVEKCYPSSSQSHTCRTPFSERVNSVLRELSMAICTMGSVEQHENKKLKAEFIKVSIKRFWGKKAEFIYITVKIHFTGSVFASSPSSEKENWSTEGTRKDNELLEWLIFLQRWLSQPASAW